MNSLSPSFRVRLVSLAAFLATILVPAGCARSAPEPRGARVISLRDLPGYSIPYGESPWSPRGLHLVVKGPEGLAVFDASRPESAPRPIFSATTWVRWNGWSPDGEWLLAIQSGQGPGSTRALIARSLEGPDSVVVVSGLEDAWPATWAPDGQIAYGEAGRIHWIAPPARWHPLESRGLVARRVLVEGPQWLDPGDTLTQSFISPFPGSSRDLIADALPGASQWLVRGIGGELSPAAVLDEQGTVTADLASLPFTASSLSSDGTLVLGYRSREDGHAILDARLWLGEVDGGFRIQLKSPTPGFKPRFAREGLVFAYEDPIGGGVHIARLQLER